MRDNVAVKTQSEELTSTNNADSVQYIDFDLKIRCARTRDGKTKFCSIEGISIEEPSKDPAPTVAVAAPRELTDENHGCDLCEALADALKEKVAATAAPRRMHSPVGRRSTVRS